MSSRQNKDQFLNIVLILLIVVSICFAGSWMDGLLSKEPVQKSVEVRNEQPGIINAEILDSEQVHYTAQPDVEEIYTEEHYLSRSEQIHILASRGHNPLSYRELWDALRLVDGEGESVRLLYSRELRSKELNGGSRGDWNREHSWPKSYGIGTRGADYTDLHAIFACDVTNNSRRGNKFFDAETDKDSWLPPSEIQGDIARAMFYMDIRYDGDDPDTKDLELTNTPNVPEGKLGMLDTLLAWHFADPVSDTERIRNGRIKEIQGNGNPFVENPSLVEELFLVE